MIMKRVLLGLFAAMTLSTPGCLFGQTTAVEEAAPQTSSDLPKARVASRPPGASSAAASALATKTGNYQNSVPPLIVQFSKTDQNHIGLLEDDLSVMSVLMDRALERALGEDSPD